MLEASTPTRTRRDIFLAKFTLVYDEETKSTSIEKGYFMGGKR